MLIKNNNIQWRGSLDELVKKKASFDLKIRRFKKTFFKSKRGEEKISAKLSAFARWIDLMEGELNQAESLDDVAKAEKFFFLKL